MAIGASSEHGSRDWDEIHGFTSPGEFERFRCWLVEAIAEDVLTEVEVGERYSGSTVFDERWYRTPDGEVWRTVAPDPPFKGAFLRVDQRHIQGQ